jgi:hypothetical protein
MMCFLCHSAILAADRVERHHPVPRSQGGQQTEPTHRACHRRHHCDDFREWGRRGGLASALTRVWAQNLLNVRTHPSFAIDRGFYLVHCSKGGAR